jgi:3-oxoacyl-[acyl-carrier-protein] synthase-1
MAMLEATATAEEPLPWNSGRPTIGMGLTEALRAVFDVKGIPVEVYCDLNGESWRADEWSYAYLRTARHFVEPLAITHPADCWGDVGAASGPMLVALAIEQMINHRSASSRALVWTASDTLPLRAACTLTLGGAYS